MNEKKWETIVRLQQETKVLYLKAEELSFGKESEFFFQPYLEQRSALDHICRARSQTLGIVDKEQEYSDSNLDKAIGHLYRAYFDTADWFGIILREKILYLLEPYDREVISTVASDYYTEFRPKFEELCHSIAYLRGAKDISVDETVIDTTIQYQAKIDELIQMYDILIRREDELIKCQQEKNAKESGKIWWAVAIGVSCAFFGALFTHLFTK